MLGLFNRSINGLPSIKCFPNLWLPMFAFQTFGSPNAFQTTSKSFPNYFQVLSKRSERQSNGEFASKRFAKTSRFPERSVQFRMRERERETLPSLALRKVIPQLSSIILANGLGRSSERITAKAYCDVLLHLRRKTVWCNRSLKVSVGTKSNYSDYLRYCSETRSETSR